MDDGGRNRESTNTLHWNEAVWRIVVADHISDTDIRIVRAMLKVQLQIVIHATNHQQQDDAFINRIDHTDEHDKRRAQTALLAIGLTKQLPCCASMELAKSKYNSSMHNSDN